MRKKFFALIMMLLVLNLLTTQLYAIDTRQITLAKTPLNKLLRGAANGTTFMLEVPASISDVSKRKGPVAGATLGIVDGVFTSVLRLATAIIDIVTFIFPPYDKPLLEPVYAIDSLTEKVSHAEFTSP